MTLTVTSYISGLFKLDIWNIWLMQDSMSILYGVCEQRNYVYERLKIVVKNRNFGYFYPHRGRRSMIYSSTGPPNCAESNVPIIFLISIIVFLLSYKMCSAPPNVFCFRQRSYGFPEFQYFWCASFGGIGPALHDSAVPK